MKINLFKKIIYFFSVILITLGLSIAFQSILAAWSTPGGNPPTCATNTAGCDAPINGSATEQYKAGALGVGGLIHGYSMAVFDGQIKISGGTPGAGKILTSDAAGLASWQAASASLPTCPVGSFLVSTGSGWDCGAVGMATYGD